MRVTIPDSYKDGFAALLAYSGPELQKLHDALARARAMPTLQGLGRIAAQSAGLDSAKVVEILRALGSLSSLRDIKVLGTDQLIQGLREGLATDPDVRLNPDRSAWEAVELLLRTVLEPGSPLVLTWKAIVLRSEYDRTFCSARVISDLRPIFKTDAERPVAALVLHSLRITYHEPEDREFSVALTKPQLLELRATIERALRKDERLRELAKETGVLLLDRED